MRQHYVAFEKILYHERGGKRRSLPCQMIIRSSLCRRALIEFLENRVVE